MGYIKRLRNKLGHEPIIMTSACVLIINEKEQILLQKRRDNGFWAYPGGSLELGESFEECAVREMKEETGLIAEKLELFATASGKEMHYIYPNQDEVFIAEAVFICRNFSGKLEVQKEEVIEQRFFHINNLPSPIFGVNKGIIQKYLQSIKMPL